MLFLAVSTFLWSHNTASACDGKSTDGAECTKANHPTDAKPARTQPGNCARQGDLVGPENCAWTTSLMAQRVIADGVSYTYVGGLEVSRKILPSKVAAPYTIGPDGAMFVIANEVLDTLSETQTLSSIRRVELTGKVLEVDGIVYFVAMGVVAADS